MKKMSEAIKIQRQIFFKYPLADDPISDYQELGEIKEIVVAQSQKLKCDEDILRFDFLINEFESKLNYIENRRLSSVETFKIEKENLSKQVIKKFAERNVQIKKEIVLSRELLEKMREIYKNVEGFM